MSWRLRFNSKRRVSIHARRVSAERDRIFRLCHKVVDSELALDNFGNPDLLRLDNAVPLLNSHEAGCWCGSAALILHQHLARLGYQSAVIDFGFPGTPATHITVVVDLGNGYCQLHDPYFNVASHPVSLIAPKVRFIIPQDELEANDFNQLCLSRSPEYGAYHARPARSLSRNHVFQVTFTIAEFFRLNPTGPEISAKTPLDILNEILRRPFRSAAPNEFADIIMNRVL